MEGVLAIFWLMAPWRPFKWKKMGKKKFIAKEASTQEITEIERNLVLTANFLARNRK